jgi:hypothetical protein
VVATQSWVTATRMDVNMVFTILVEFRVLTEDVVELALGAGRVMFKKPENPGAHMMPLFIRGHLDGTPVRHMLMDGGASINILPLLLFKKLSHIKGDRKYTNLTRSSFAGDPTKANGIICKEVMVGSKTMPMAFFVVDIKGCYNVLLGRDWIHANECVLSTLHQCIIQCIGDEVEVLQADENVCITMTKSQVDIQGGKMKCLTGRYLTGYDYICIGKDGFVLISVKPAIGATQLTHDLVQMAVAIRELEWLSRRTVEYRSSRDDTMGVVEDLDELGKLGQGFASMDNLEKVDIGDGVIPRPTYVSAHLNTS